MYNTIQQPAISSWFSNDTKTLTRQLIENLQIQQGSQLAKILGVNRILYNDEAMHVWVQRQIDEGLIINNETIGTLEKKFINLVNEYQHMRT